MSVGSKVVVQHLGDDGAWEDYLSAHLLEVNPFSSRESQDDGGELPYQTASFVLRYRKALPPLRP